MRLLQKQSKADPSTVVGIPEKLRMAARLSTVILSCFETRTIRTKLKELFLSAQKRRSILEPSTIQIKFRHRTHLNSVGATVLVLSLHSLRTHPHWTHRRKSQQVEPAVVNGSLHTTGKQHQRNCRKFACLRPVWIGPEIHLAVQGYPSSELCRRPRRR